MDIDLYDEADNWQTLSDSGYITNHDIDLELLKRHRSQGSTLNWFDRRQDLYEVILKK